jgi:hypothetical protein
MPFKTNFYATNPIDSYPEHYVNHPIKGQGTAQQTTRPKYKTQISSTTGRLQKWKNRSIGKHKVVAPATKVGMTNRWGFKPLIPVLAAPIVLGALGATWWKKKKGGKTSAVSQTSTTDKKPTIIKKFAKGFAGAKLLNKFKTATQ